MPGPLRPIFATHFGQLLVPGGEVVDHNERGDGLPVGNFVRSNIRARGDRTMVSAKAGAS